MSGTLTSNTVNLHICTKRNRTGTSLIGGGVGGVQRGTRIGTELFLEGDQAEKLNILTQIHIFGTLFAPLSTPPLCPKTLAKLNYFYSPHYSPYLVPKIRTFLFNNVQKPLFMWITDVYGMFYYVAENYCINRSTIVYKNHDDSPILFWANLSFRESNKTSQICLWSNYQNFNIEWKILVRILENWSPPRAPPRVKTPPFGLPKYRILKT